MKVKILVVDDSAVMRKMIIQTIYKGTVFNEENSEMVQAQDGVQGVEQFKEAQPHIVLSDWNMPTMDGMEMISKIREIDQKVPIIMITSEGTKHAAALATSPGKATDYVVKPLTVGTLEEKLIKAFQSLVNS